MILVFCEVSCIHKGAAQAKTSNESEIGKITMLGFCRSHRRNGGDTTTLVLTTKRKSHTTFRFLPNSMILYDFDRYNTLFVEICSYNFEIDCAEWTPATPILGHLSATKCSRRNLFLAYTNCGVFVGFLG